MAKAARPSLTRRQLLTRLRRVRLLTLDVDGVLTDGGLYFANSGDEMRKYNAKDGLGLKLVRRAGIEIAIVSAGIGAAIGNRAKRLSIPHVLIDVDSKLAAVGQLCNKLGIPLSAVAHMGDDLNDLPVLRAVGLALAPADAVAPVRTAAAWVSRHPGGGGCVREICDLILDAHDIVPDAD